MVLHVHTYQKIKVLKGTLLLHSGNIMGVYNYYTYTVPIHLMYEVI